MTFREAFDKILVGKNGKICHRDFVKNRYLCMKFALSSPYIYDSEKDSVISDNILINYFWSNSEGWEEYKEPLKFEENRLYKTEGGYKVKISAINGGHGSILGVYFDGKCWHGREWLKNGAPCSSEPWLNLIDYWEEN